MNEILKEQVVRIGEIIDELNDKYGNDIYYYLLDIADELENDFDIEVSYRLDDFVDEDYLDEWVQQVAKDGFRRLVCFIGNVEFFDNIYHVNGYGNIENEDDLSTIKEDILLELSNRLDELNNIK